MKVFSSERGVQFYDLAVLVILGGFTFLAVMLFVIGGLATQTDDDDDGSAAVDVSPTPSPTPLAPPTLNSSIPAIYDAGEPIVLRGTASSGATVRIAEGQRELTTVTVDRYGEWTARLENGLPAGEYTFVLTATDETQRSERLLLRIETQARAVGGLPPAGEQQPGYGAPTGRISPPEITPLLSSTLQGDAPVLLQGMARDARFVSVLNGDEVLGRAEVNIVGRWQLELMLEPGTPYALSVQALDSASNRSRAVSVPIIIDTAAPPTPSASQAGR
jgi:hypothetical protein